MTHLHVFRRKPEHLQKPHTDMGRTYKPFPIITADRLYVSSTLSPDLLPNNLISCEMIHQVFVFFKLLFFGLLLVVSQQHNVVLTWLFLSLTSNKLFYFPLNMNVTWFANHCILFTFHIALQMGYTCEEFL